MNFLSRTSRRQSNLLGAAICAALMGFALYAQYGLHLTPCNMCILQRIAVVALGAVFLVAGVHNPGRGGARFYALLIGVATLLSVSFSARQVWMQLQPEGSLPSCGADFYTMLDMLPVRDVVTRIWMGGADCQKITWSFLGLSMAAWLVIIVTLLGLGGITANLNGRGKRGEDQRIRFA